MMKNIIKYLSEQRIIQRLIFQILMTVFFTFLFFALNLFAQKESLTWAYFLDKDNFVFVFSIIFLGILFPNLRVQKIFFILLLFLTSVELIHFAYYNTPIRSFEIWAFFVSLEETFLVLKTKSMLVAIFKILFCSVFVYWIISFLLKKYQANFIKIPYFQYVFIIGISIFCALNFINKKNFGIFPNLKQHVLRSGFDGLIGFIHFVVPSRFGLIGEKIPLINTPNPDQILDHSFNIIVVMGESLNYKNMNMYQDVFTSETENFIQKYAFIRKLALVGGISTGTSLPRFFNLLEYPAHYDQVFSENTSLFKLAKKQDFKTSFITTQTPYNMSGIVSHMGRKYIDTVIFGSNYDEELPVILSKLNLNQGQQFVVLHQSAAHEVYIDAVPPDFRKQFDQISDYQMAVNYVEYVWQKIIDVLANTTAPTYVFFTADHSEAQMETGGKKGHGFFGEEVIVVPFLYTTFNIKNDRYREKIPSNNLVNHSYISKLIASILGYKQNLQVDKTYYVNGSDELGMEGILEVETDGDRILKTEIKTMDIFYKKLNF